MKVKYLSLVLIALTLTGCGGGGGSDASVDSGTDYATKYVGTWKTACGVSSDIVDATTNSSANSIDVVTFTRSSNTQLKSVYTTQVFASNDPTCSQASLGSIVYTGAGNGSFVQSASGFVSSAGFALKVDSQTTVDNKTVDKVTFEVEALTNVGNGTYTAGTGNRFKINPADFGAVTVKNLAFVNNGTITFGNHSGVPNSEYPSTLASYADLTKQ